MIFHSIRWRLQLWHGLILLAVLAGFGFTAHRLQRANELRRVDQDLQRRLGPLLESLRRPPATERNGPPDLRPPRGEPDDRGRRGPPPRESSTQLPASPREFRLGSNRAALFEGDTNAFYYVVWTRDGRELGRSESALAEVFRPEPSNGKSLVPVTRMRGTMRELYEFTPPGECILVGRSIAPELANLRQLALWLSGLGSAVLVLGLAGGWWLATRAIRPIGEISAAAATIAAGNLSHRINAADTDNELGQLAGVLNSTFARLERAFARQQEFTADASHELRTPITVILSQTQATLARERSPAEYRETLQACQRAAQRMRQLTESLLALARLDAGQKPVERENFDIGRSAIECIDLIRPLASERRIALHSDLAPAECSGDPERIAQVITNLLVNAIQHSDEASQVHISTRREHNSVVLTVTDEGPGVPPDVLQKIFDRFYRTDQSRDRRTGGIGLGLAIVKSCVEAGGGSIVASNVEPHGLQMVVRLPAASAI